jgi:hypothetical protein
VRTRTIKYAEISLKEKHIVNIPLVLNIRESWVNRLIFGPNTVTFVNQTLCYI